MLSKKSTIACSRNDVWWIWILSLEKHIIMLFDKLILNSSDIAITTKVDIILIIFISLSNIIIILKWLFWYQTYYKTIILKVYVL